MNTYIYRLYIYIYDTVLTMLIVSIILFYRALNSIIGTQINWQQAMEFIGSLEIIDDENGSLKAIVHVRGNTKGPVMESLLSEMNLDQNEVISVGDTVVELPLFERSLFSIAVNTEDTRVIEKANYHHRSKNLTELIPVISKLAKH